MSAAVSGLPLRLLRQSRSTLPPHTVSSVAVVSAPALASVLAATALFLAASAMSASGASEVMWIASLPDAWWNATAVTSRGSIGSRSMRLRYDANTRRRVARRGATGSSTPTQRSRSSRHAGRGRRRVRKPRQPRAAPPRRPRTATIANTGTIRRLPRTPCRRVPTVMPVSRIGPSPDGVGARRMRGSRSSSECARRHGVTVAVDPSIETVVARFAEMLLSRFEDDVGRAARDDLGFAVAVEVDGGDLHVGHAVRSERRIEDERLAGLAGVVVEDEVAQSSTR